MNKFKLTINRFYPRIKKMDKLLIILLICIGVYIFYFSSFTFAKQDMFLAGRYDLGNMDQTVWNTLHGRIFTFTNPDFNKEMSRLSVHADFILILFAPFYLIWNDPKMLLLIQTVIVGFGGLFVYLLGKDVLKGRRLIPLALAFSYLLNPFVERQNIFEFHSVVLATTFLLACFYFLQKNKYLPFFIFLALAVLTKEHIYAVVGFIGLYIYFVKKKRWGIVLSIFSFTAFYLLIAKIIPHFRMHNHFALAFYDDFGSSPAEIMKSFFTNPHLTISLLMKNNLLVYCENLLRPAGYLSLFAPFHLIFALPELLINSLSKNPNWRMYIYHYSAVSIPFVYISAIYGVRRILNFFPKLGILLFVYICFFAVYSANLYGPLPWAMKPDPSMKRSPLNKQLITNYLKTIPPDAFVASSNNLGAHLSHRRQNYSLETKDYLKAQYVLFLVQPNSIEDLDSKNGDVIKVRDMLKNPDFKVIYRLNNFIVFQRIKLLTE